MWLSAVNDELFWYWMAFLILVFLLISIKWFVIFNQYKGENPLFYQILYFLSDYPVLIVFSFFILLNNCSSIILWIFIDLFLLLSCFYFYIDVITIKYFSYRAYIPDIFSFFSIDWFLQYKKHIFLLLFLFLSLLLFSIFLTQWFIYHHIISFNFYILLFGFFITTYFFSKIILHYRKWNIRFFGNIYTLNNIINVYNWNPFYNYKKWDNNKKYEEYVIKENWENKKPNIILIFSESLSSIDSKLLWWYDNLKFFDEIQKEWIILKNFISNWTCSLQAHVGVFQWCYPYQYDDYTCFNSIGLPLPEWLNNKWYYTEFISACPLSFLNQRNRLKEIWFKKIVWEEAFSQEKHFSRNASPDWMLYKKVIEEVKNKKDPYFIWLQTISFHPDLGKYSTPYWDTHDLALKYSEDTLYDFFLNLKSLNFFDTWILIIIWDHRKQIWMVEWELEKMWNNRYTRCIATVVWCGIKSWLINRNILQHTDFFFSIKKLVWKWEIEMDKMYNYVFDNKGTCNRNWWITMNINKLLWNDIFTISKLDGDSYSFNKIERETVKNDELYNHLTSQIKYQIDWINLNIQLN